MKVVSTEALTKLIQLVKSAFIKVEDVVETSEVALADVALSGDYDDLINKPTVVTEATVSGWGFTKNTGTVTSVNNVSPVNGNVSLSIPTVPTNVSAFTNDAGYITNSALTGYATQVWVGQQGYITGITSSDVTTALGYTPYNSSNPNGYITSSALTPYVLSSSLATVATSGSYNDLSNKPDLTTKADVDLSNTSPSQTFKNNVMNWVVPDYNSAVFLGISVKNSSYTIQNTGYYLIKLSKDSASKGAKITVNGIEVMWISSQSVWESTKSVLLLNQGDVVSCINADVIYEANIDYYLPFKGVN